MNAESVSNSNIIARYIAQASSRNRGMLKRSFVMARRTWSPSVAACSTTRDGHGTRLLNSARKPFSQYSISALIHRCEAAIS